MKYSGVEWIGYLPNKWEVARIKDIARMQTGTTPPKNTGVNIDGNGVNWFTPGDFIDGSIILEDSKKFIDFKTIQQESIKVYPKYSVLFVGIASIGKFGYFNNECYSNQQITAIKPYDISTSKFISYALLASMDSTKNNALYTTVPILNNAYLGTIQIPYPSLSTQQKITEYLDYKCGQVDGLIANQQAQIEKLKQYKQSVITEAVTRGLNPSAPLKDSGIDWIGSIPENWSAIKIKYLADSLVENSFIDGDWIDSPYIEDNGIRYITTGNIGNGYFKRQGNGYISIDTFNKLNCKYAFAGDLIFSRLNAEYGRSCILPFDHEKYVIAVDNVILRTQQDKRFICYVSQCPNYQKAVYDYARGTAMKRISRTNLGNITIPIPPFEEQQQIADYLDNKCGEIDRLISLKQQKIDALTSYKKSLIYEYVTGKKEVI